MFKDFFDLAERQLSSARPSRADAGAVLTVSDDEVLTMVAAAGRVRRAHFGNREMHLRSLQPLALHLANSLFLGDYLTSEGQAAQADLAMIADAGFRVLSPRSGPVGDARNHATTRTRGAGTELAPNA